MGKNALPHRANGKGAIGANNPAVATTPQKTFRYLSSKPRIPDRPCKSTVCRYYHRASCLRCIKITGKARNRWCMGRAKTLQRLVDCDKVAEVKSILSRQWRKIKLPSALDKELFHGNQTTSTEAAFRCIKKNVEERSSHVQKQKIFQSQGLLNLDSDLNGMGMTKFDTKSMMFSMLLHWKKTERGRRDKLLFRMQRKTK